MKSAAGKYSFRRLFSVAALLKVCAVSFYIGYRNAVNEISDVAASGTGGVGVGGCGATTLNEISETMRQQIDARVKDELKSARAVEGYFDKLFPETVKEFAVGALRVSREELMKKYDFGVPAKKEKSIESIVLYNTVKSLPSSKRIQRAAVHGKDAEIGKASVSEAMENCDTLNVIFTSLQSNAPECRLLIGNALESYQVNRWLRMPLFTESNRKERELKHELTLRHTGRIVLRQGVDEFDLPPVWQNFKKREKGPVTVMGHFGVLKVFLKNVDSVLKGVKEILQQRNIVRNNAVVVMTVNAGQSELLSNFICSARSKGFGTENVLVFPTDEESNRLARGLGVATYFDESNLGILPSGEAKFYGDPIFASMMYAKVLCVLYVSLLGHDVLFQDVDVVWFKNPLNYFHDKSNKAIQDFDVLFQHDGSAQARYNPLSANSGFYYVRANKKTQYLFTSLLYHGAVVRKSKSHQQVLVQMLNEHSSMFGLKVKVFDKFQTDLFPGGFHYHQDWDTMRAIIGGKSNAYILHMSWTENKVNKLLFFRQLGEWFLQDKCSGNEALNLMTRSVADGGLVDQCCSKEPIFSCHFKDKPSKVPCPDSPKIDPKKGKLFWK